MKFSLCTLISAAAFAGQAIAYCDNPEKSERICYNEQGGTPQDVNPRNIVRLADFLRVHGSDPAHAFYAMPLPAANNCAEWTVTSYRDVLVLAKLVGNLPAKVTFDDIANTLDGGSSRKKRRSALYGCGRNGGQMALRANASDVRYGGKEFEDGRFTNEGILIKVVRNVLVEEEMDVQERLEI